MITMWPKDNQVERNEVGQRDSGRNLMLSVLLCVQVGSKSITECKTLDLYIKKALTDRK